MIVFSNLATSIDGKIATVSREFFPLGSKKDLLAMQDLRNKCDVLLMGAGTLRAFRRPCLPAKKSRHIVNAIVSRDLSGIDPAWPFFKSDRIDRILFVTGRVPAARRREFEKTSRVVQLSKGAEKNPAPEILKVLKRSKLSRVLVEGGGALMWEFVKENLIDRYYLTLTPRALGGAGGPSLIDGEGLAPHQVVNLELKSVRKVGSELFLEYAKLPVRGRKHPRLT